MIQFMNLESVYDRVYEVSVFYVSRIMVCYVALLLAASC
jgi:hypothetical protein